MVRWTDWARTPAVMTKPEVDRATIIAGLQKDGPKIVGPPRGASFLCTVGQLKDMLLEWWSGNQVILTPEGISVLNPIGVSFRPCWSVRPPEFESLGSVDSLRSMLDQFPDRCEIHHNPHGVYVVKGQDIVGFLIEAPADATG